MVLAYAIHPALGVTRGPTVGDRNIVEFLSFSLLYFLSSMSGRATIEPWTYTCVRRAVPC